MAKSIKEIGKKAETLLEQGREAERNVQRCLARVASANSRVSAARRQLAAASETDEEGRPVGDVAAARAQLSMAEHQLAASRRALESAQQDANRVMQGKRAHVREIEHHNRVERSNLEKLRRLRGSAFAADSAALTEGMAQRLNEAEDARVALLRSMGIEATADYVSAGGDGAAGSGWRGGGFAPLDISGQAQSYHGGGAGELGSGGGITTPIGGGLGSTGGIFKDDERSQEKESLLSERSLCKRIVDCVPPNRKHTMELAFGDAPKEIISELNRFSNVLQPVVDSGFGRNKYGRAVKKGSFYAPDFNQVKMNEEMDDDEYQEVLPHELSHFLDHQRGWDSSKPEFIAALDSDLKRFNRNTPEGKAFFHEMLDDAVNTGAADDRAVSDLIFGAFGENGNDPEIIRRFDKEAIAKFTHSDEYWMGIDAYGCRSPDGGASMRRAEIYAEIGAVRCLNNRISNNFLERYFPNIYKQFNIFYNIERKN